MIQEKFNLFLSRIFEATGINSRMELADILKINRSAITQASKRNSIPEKWLLNLFRRYGLNPEWMETGLGEKFIKKNSLKESGIKRIPKVRARLCAGGGSFESDSDVDGYYFFQHEWLSKKGVPDKMVLMDVFGNSMQPEIREGDTVLIDESQVDIFSGAIFAVGVDDTIMIKRLEKHPDKLVLLSDNRDYAPVYLERNAINSLRVIGKVIWVCREFK
ncbi:MAG: transcriptional regulator [Desulfobacteraceae bacterium 4572_19]|nr:MAG: transcriptional regulator [Desulfobacteraceae bacterium 4572_19]